MSTDRRTVISMLLAAAVPLPARLLRNATLMPEPRDARGVAPAVPIAPTCQDLPIHDVRDHGAVGDGQADDAASIQRVIDAIGTAGGVVYFPAGDYRIETTLYYRSGLRFLGEPGSRLIQATTVLFDQASRGFTGNLAFEGLTITRGESVPDDYQNRSGKGGPVTALKLYARSNVNDVRVSRCTFVDMAGRAVFIKGVSQLSLEANAFRNLYDAVEVGSAGDATTYGARTVNGLRIIGNSFENVSTGVVLQGLSDARLGHYAPSGRISSVTVSGNRFRRTAFIGVEAYASNDGVTMEDNVFEDSFGASLSAKLSRNIIIRNNIAPQILVQGARDAAYDFALQNVTITDNTVVGNADVVAKKGIMVWRQAQNVTIARNLVIGHDMGISIGLTPSERAAYPGEEQTDIVVSSNICHDNATYGLHTLAVTRACFANNYSYENGRASSAIGTGHRIDGPLVDSGIYGDVYQGRGASGKQAFGLDVAPGAMQGQTVITGIRSDRNRISDSRGFRGS